MGGDIQYGIVDVVTMVSEVVNHQEILRSLSKTLLVKTLVRKSVRQIQKERLSIACEIQDEINLQVRKWGIHIQRVDLSEPYIGNNAIYRIFHTYSNIFSYSGATRKPP